MDSALTKPIALETLYRCIAVGQRKGAFTIKHAAQLHKIIAHLKDIQKDETLTEAGCIEGLVKSVVVANEHGAYTIDDAAVIDKIFEYLIAEKLVDAPQAPVESKGKEPASA